MTTHSGQTAPWKDVFELRERRDGKSFVEPVPVELGFEDEVSIIRQRRDHLSGRGDGREQRRGAVGGDGVFPSLAVTQGAARRQRARWE